MPFVKIEKSFNTIKSMNQTMHHGHLKMLVCDDDPTIRKIVVAVLESAGHYVEAASDGREALEKIQAKPAFFDALITDNLMPRLSGIGLVEKLREANIPMKVIMITGYGMESATKSADHPQFDGFLMKPFKATDLLQCLKNLYH